VVEKHEIRVMPILFDDCNFSDNVARTGNLARRPDAPGMPYISAERETFRKYSLTAKE
jgi:hypothetical protein